MRGPVGAKHRIKRVWRFLRNAELEVDAVSGALIRELAPREGPVMAAEERVLERFEQLCPTGREVIVVADRGFGNARWMGSVKRRGWYFVQRVSRVMFVEVEQFIGTLEEMELRRGARAHDWGWGMVGERRAGHAVRLITRFARDAKEPWYLVTNLDCVPARIVRLYQRRMWIEAMFRDGKNRQWGFGPHAVRLSEPQRHDRLFTVPALAYMSLCAFGAAAEQRAFDRLLKANTEKTRVMTILRIGAHALKLRLCSQSFALAALTIVPT